jgi:HNH endonuclease/NUMOD4 motif
MRWLPVVGHEGSYEVSDTGLVRSLDRSIETRNGSRWAPEVPGTPGIRRLKGRILRPGPKPSGHLHVVLSGRDDRDIHVLVLEAFVGPPLPGQEACHADDDPANNHLDNLSWGTKSDNAFDMIRNGRHFQVNKTVCKWGHPLVGANVRLDSRGYRHCKECGRRRGREWLQRRRG